MEREEPARTPPIRGGLRQLAQEDNEQGMEQGTGRVEQVNRGTVILHHKLPLLLWEGAFLLGSKFPTPRCSRLWVSFVGNQPQRPSLINSNLDSFFTVVKRERCEDVLIGERATISSRNAEDPRDTNRVESILVELNPIGNVRNVGLGAESIEDRSESLKYG